MTKVDIDNEVLFFTKTFLTRPITHTISVLALKFFLTWITSKVQAVILQFYAHLPPLRFSER